MARRFRYLTHTQIDRDPAVPIPRWRLSDLGRERLTGVDWRSFLHGTGVIYSSVQTRALETASVIADAMRVPMQVRHEMREADRGPMGYVADGAIATIVDRFFSDPMHSVQGWETAADAQRRIVKSVDQALHDYPDQDVLFVGHGTVGALLYCHWAGHAISGEHRQSDDGGNLFSFFTPGRRLELGWTALEDATRKAGDSSA